MNINDYVGKRFKVIGEDLIAEEHDLKNGDIINITAAENNMLISPDLTWWCCDNTQNLVLAPENRETNDEEYLRFLVEVLEEVK